MDSKAGEYYKVGSTVFRGKFCEITWAGSQHSVTHCRKIVKIPQLTAAICL